MSIQATSKEDSPGGGGCRGNSDPSAVTAPSVEAAATLQIPRAGEEATILFHSLLFRIFDSINDRIDAALRNSIETGLPFLPEDMDAAGRPSIGGSGDVDIGSASGGTKAQRPPEKLLSILRNLYGTNLDIAEAYACRNVFALPVGTGPKRQEKIVKAYLAGGVDQEGAGADQSTNADGTFSASASAANQHAILPNKETIPTPEQIAAIDEETAALRKKLRDVCRKRTDLRAVVSKLGQAHGLAKGAKRALVKPDEVEDNRQTAVDLLFGGELYAKLLGYTGRQGIMYLRDDQLWRKAMDSLPAKDLSALGIPVVSRPNELDLFLLRSLLTEPVVSLHTGKGIGWKLNDLGTRILASSSFASDEMLQSLVYPGCDEKVLSHLLVDENKHLSASLLTKILVSCPSPPKISLFERIATQQNATSPILSSILLRSSTLSQYSEVAVCKIYLAVASHRNTSEPDLHYLTAHKKRTNARKGVAVNVNAARFGLLHPLSKDKNVDVRAACAANIDAPRTLLFELAMDSDIKVRKSVAENSSADQDLLKTIAASNTDQQLLGCVARNSNCSVDEIFSASNKRHRMTIATFSNDPVILSNLVGMDGGSYDDHLAANDNTPVDVLPSLAKSEDEEIRYALAQHRNITTPLIEELLQDEDKKSGLAYNESLPFHIFQLLSVDGNDDVRENLACNVQVPPEILERMVAVDGESKYILDDIYVYNGHRLSITALEAACRRDLASEEEISMALASAVLNHDDTRNLSAEILAALANNPKEDVRVQTLQHPCLPVGDIIRLYHDVALDKKMVNKFIRRNALLQVAVDKLFHLYFKSKHGVGDDSYFEDGEHWW